MLILYVFDVMERTETARGDATATAFLDIFHRFGMIEPSRFFGGNYAFSDN